MECGRVRESESDCLIFILCLSFLFKTSTLQEFKYFIFMVWTCCFEKPLFYFLIFIFGLCSCLKTSSTLTFHQMSLLWESVLFRLLLWFRVLFNRTDQYPIVSDKTSGMFLTEPVRTQIFRINYGYFLRKPKPTRNRTEPIRNRTASLPCTYWIQFLNNRNTRTRTVLTRNRPEYPKSQA